MATMIMCGNDWSFDKFAEAMDSVEALPMARGVRPSANLSDEQRFCVYVKTAIKFADFSDYRHTDETIKEVLYDLNFSDWYKDTFNQRPHFDWVLVGALCGVYGSMYNIMKWDMRDPIGYYKTRSKEVREALEAWAREEAM